MRPSLAVCGLLLVALSVSATVSSSGAVGGRASSAVVADPRRDLLDGAPSAMAAAAHPRLAVDVHRVTYRVHDGVIRTRLRLGDVRPPARHDDATSTQHVLVVLRFGKRFLRVSVELARRGATMAYAANFRLVRDCLPLRSTGYDAASDLVQVDVSTACFPRRTRLALVTTSRLGVDLGAAERTAWSDPTTRARLRLP